MNYYNHFISHLTTVAVPIINLLSVKGPFVWGEQQQRAFEQLKAKLTSAPVLKLPDFSKPFQMHCDASVVGLGAELSQE